MGGWPPIGRGLPDSCMGGDVLVHGLLVHRRCDTPMDTHACTHVLDASMCLCSYLVLLTQFTFALCVVQYTHYVLCVIHTVCVCVVHIGMGA